MTFTWGRTGWTCPGCRRCYSPDVSMCFYCPASTWTWTPSNPYGTGVAPLTVGQDGVVPLTVGTPVWPHVSSGQTGYESGYEETT